MRRLSHILEGMVLMTLTFAGAAGADTAALEEQARGLAMETATHAYPGARVSVTVTPLDPRLRLQRCDDLSMEIPGNRIAGRITVHARCRAPVSWGIYLSAQVDVVLPVVVTVRPVPRDSVIRAADLALESRNLAELRDGHLTDLEDAVGMAARTGLQADRVLYQRHLAPRRLVSKGDAVTLAAHHGQVVVTTRAVALADGAYGERIELRNPRSNRTTSGWVTGPGQVSTRPEAGPRRDSGGTPGFKSR